MREAVYEGPRAPDGSRDTPDVGTARRLGTAVALSLGAVVMVAGSVFAQAGDKCLGNSGERTVSPGASYTDRSGLWECRPDDPSATAGGWVLVDAPSGSTASSPTPTATSPTVTPTVTPTATAFVLAPSGNSGGRTGQTGGTDAAIVATSVAVMVLLAAFMVWRRQRGPRVSGWLEVGKEE